MIFFNLNIFWHSFGKKLQNIGLKSSLSLRRYVLVAVMTCFYFLQNKYPMPLFQTFSKFLRVNYPLKRKKKKPNSGDHCQFIYEMLLDDTSTIAIWQFFGKIVQNIGLKSKLSLIRYFLVAVIICFYFFQNMYPMPLFQHPYTCVHKRSLNFSEWITPSNEIT